MFTLERLEMALLSRWGREEMTVYADYLQSIGDPRGEVIAIDLVNLDTINESAWRARRHDVLAAWLGEDLATHVGPMIFQGFVQEAGTDPLLLASPAGDFVRAARLGTDLTVLDRLVERPRPWLTRLAITVPSQQGTLLDEAQCAKLVATTPRLDELVLRGRAIARRFSHPSVRHVRLEGEAVGELGWQGAWFSPPSDLAIERVRQPTPVADTRLYLAGTESPVALAQPALQQHVTHVRYTGEPSMLARILDALPKVGVVETTTSGRPYQHLQTVVARFSPRVELATIDR